MNPRDDPTRPPDRKEWFIALAVALAFHVVAIVVLGFLFLLAQAHHRPEMPDAVQVDLVTDPRSFTELPPDRKSVPPEHPDFLSNVTSRAADLAPGGDASLPKMSGPSDAPMVKLDTKPASPSSSVSPPAPQPTDPGMTPQTPSDAAPPGPPGAAGNSDSRQPEMDNPDGNAGLTGDVSLSTTNWDYAPWLQRFGREVMRRWIAPPAYRMGLLKDGGWAVIDMEITPDGKVMRVDLVGQQGHPSLILAAQSALHGMNPVEPLPADFPDKTLILHIRMVYPKYSEIRPAEGEPELPHRGRRR